MLYAGIISDLQDQAERTFFDLETVTKNINNISTPGYKAERSFSFEDTLQKVQKNMEAGKLTITHNPNDVSLEGKGFFVLKDKDGQNVFTRNITLTQDKEGNLVSGDYLICPKTEVPKGFVGYEVETNGEVLGKRSDGSKIPFAHLKVLNFPAAEKLEFDGLVYRATADAGEPLEVCLGPTSQTKVRQHTQELSNVETPLEFSKFAQVNQKLTTISRLNQLLNTSEREYIRTLTSLVQ